MITLSPSEAIPKLDSFIVNWAKEVAETEIKTHPNWFTIQEINDAPHQTLKPCVQTIPNLKYWREPLQIQKLTLSPTKNKETSKEKMASFLVNHCQREQFKDEPKATWNIVFKIIEGFNTHHKKYCKKKQLGKLGNPEGTLPSHLQL